MGGARAQDVLLAAAQRYHELQLADAAAQVQRILAADPLTAEVRVKDAQAARQLCVTLGLPAQLDTSTAAAPSTAGAKDGGAGGGGGGGGGVAAGGLPATPFAAPFTPLVPQLLRVVRGYVQDSASYLRGLLPAWEMEEALTQARDRMVQRVVVEALLGRAAALAQKNQVCGVHRACRLYLLHPRRSPCPMQGLRAQV